ncbi:hypothetical protein [Streptomyces sp. NPDC051684]|uniref:hypothetical protein n=1 Tax=Streptomyces sp. NPDC051684 TaxID=3365670 RepID=UPI00379DFAE9
MQREPQHITIDGRRMVALPLPQFESLLAQRRQLGAQSSRMQSMRGALSDVASFLERLEAAWTQNAEDEELVTELRRHARHTRALGGTKRSGRSPKTRRKRRS